MSKMWIGQGAELSAPSSVWIGRRPGEGILVAKKEWLLKLWMVLTSVSMLAASAAIAEDDSAAAIAEKRREALTRPELATEVAPDKFAVLFNTTVGDFSVEVTRAWAPNSADRFYNMVRVGFFDDGIAFFRVIPGSTAQFGLHGDTEVSRFWRFSKIAPDPVTESNERGTLSFAKKKDDARSTQMFINLKDNLKLDRRGFAPFARVVGGMEAVDAIYPVGDGAPKGPGPNQRALGFRGNTYLRSKFPKISYITRATFVDLKGDDAESAPAAVAVQPKSKSGPEETRPSK